MAITHERWQPWNNGHGEHIWFLSRKTPSGLEYHWSRADSLIRYKTWATASAAAARLNHQNTAQEG